jgi:hypothetical protein
LRFNSGRAGAHCLFLKEFRSEPLRPSERGKDQIGFGGKRKNWSA